MIPLSVETSIYKPRSLTSPEAAAKISVFLYLFSGLCGMKILGSCSGSGGFFSPVFSTFSSLGSFYSFPLHFLSDVRAKCSGCGHPWPRDSI